MRRLSREISPAAPGGARPAHAGPSVGSSRLVACLNSRMRRTSFSIRFIVIILATLLVCIGISVGAGNVNYDRTSDIFAFLGLAVAVIVVLLSMHNSLLDPIVSDRE